MQQPRAREQCRQDREGERRQEPGQAGAHTERQGQQCDAHRHRCGARSRAEGDVSRHPAGAVADRHPADRSREEVGGAERRRQPARRDLLCAVGEVRTRRVGGGETGVRKRERQLGKHEHREGRHEGCGVEAREHERRGAEGDSAAFFSDHDGYTDRDEDERDRVALEGERREQRDSGENDGHVRRQRVTCKRRGRIGDEAPRNLQEQQPDDELHAPDDRPGKCPRRKVEEP